MTSTPGRGSRFYVEVPVQAAEASEVMVEGAGVQQVIGLEPGQPDYRILIVEDQQENWILLERLLQSVGFQVRVATDGLRGVEHVGPGAECLGTQLRRVRQKHRSLPCHPPPAVRCGAAGGKLL